MSHVATQTNPATIRSDLAQSQGTTGGSLQMVSKKLNAAFLLAFFEAEGELQKHVAEQQRTRMSLLWDKAKHTTQAEFSEARSEFLSKYPKDQDESKHNAAKVRMSEMQTIFTAFRLELIDNGEGYHATVQSARQALKEAKLKPNGEPKLDDEQRESAAESKRLAKALQQIAKEGKQYGSTAEKLEAAEQLANLMRIEEDEKAEQAKLAKISESVAKLIQDPNYAFALATMTLDALGYNVVTTKRDDTDAPM